jgi:peptide/nickel transport system permease protein
VRVSTLQTRTAEGAPGEPRRRASRDLIRGDPLSVAAVALLIAVAVASLAAPLVAPADPYAVNNAVRLSPPGDHGFILGSDELGRDILSRLLWGGRVSLVVALVPTLIALIVGTFLGLVAGYFRGPIDGVIMRAMDIVLAFPYILLAIAIAAALGPGLWNAMFALSFVSVPIFARLIRASVLSIREQEFVTAARAIGATAPRILGRHVFPNTVSVLIVYGTLQTGTKVIAAASLSFLGIGVQQPEADWGGMLAAGRTYLREAPHVATIPGLLVFVVTLAFNIAGEALRDRLDPRMRGR